MKKGNFLAGILAGAAAGAVAGILMAPDKGSVTRENLSRKGSDTLDNLKTKFSGFVDEVSEKYISSSDGQSSTSRHQPSEMRRTRTAANLNEPKVPGNRSNM